MTAKSNIEHKRRLKVRAAIESMEPVDWQEPHDPTEWVRLRLTAKRQTHVALRRIIDARLFDAMSVAQMEAAERIAAAFKTIASGLGAKTQKFERIDASKSSGCGETLLLNYWDWHKRLRAAKIDLSAILDVIVFGLSCRSVDQSRRKRRGWARENLFAGLSVYVKMRGW